MPGLLCSLSFGSVGCAETKAKAPKVDPKKVAGNIPGAADSQTVWLLAQYGDGPAQSAGEVADFYKVIRQATPKVDAAVLASWLGGAPPKKGKAWDDKRRDAIDTAREVYGLGDGPVPTVQGALAYLRKRAPNLGALVEAKGNAKTVKAAKSFADNVKQEQEAFKDKVAEVATVGGLGIGGAALLALAVVAIAR